MSFASAGNPRRPRWRGLARQGLAVILAASVTFTSAPVQAAGLIRDAEIEGLIRDYAKPIFRVAGLGSQNIKIHLVSDRSFNAFVVDGRNMFINVGTLSRSESPNQVIGVIAHETGHIAGGHLAQLREMLASARSATLMLRLLGIAAMAASAIAGGGADVGQAGLGLMLGGENLTMRTILAYRRTQESQADQAAVTFLNATGQSAKGMLDTFAYFADQSLASLKYVDPYVQSHPMPQDRITQLNELAQRSRFFDRRDPPELQVRHDMMRAKLSGFLDDPRTVFNKYPRSDQSLPANYARTIALFRQSGIGPFLPQVDALIAAQPNNPYFYEIKGQFLFKSGKAAAAIEPLRKAVALAPDAALIRILYAQALIAADEKRFAEDAIKQLRNALVQENTSAVGYRQLATAYGLQGDIAEAELASAHAYMYEGKLPLAKQQAKRAKAKFARGTPNWIKADDILNFNPPKN